MSTTTNTAKPDKSELPSPKDAFEWPRQAMREQQWSVAAQRWAVLRKAYPEHPATWLQAAIAHIEANELNQADELLTYARPKFSENPNTLLQTAELAMRREQWDIAEEFLQQAREKFPEYMQTWLKSADCAEHRGDRSLAESYNEKARQIDPDLPASFIQHAEQAMRAEQWDKALERWAVLRQQFPDMQAGYYRAAEAARQLGDSKEARKLTLAHQYGPDILTDEPQAQYAPKPHSRHTNLKRLVELIWTKATFNLRSEVHRNYLSYGWWVLEPLLHMIVYYVVFGMLLNRGRENFPVFLLTGLIPWMWFMKTVNSSSNSILAGQNLMLHVGVPSIIFPLITFVQSTIKQIPVFVLLLGFVWLQGYTPNEHWWVLLPVILVHALLTLVFSCIVAAVIPFVRDLAYLVPTGLTFLMFLSGIFYDYRTISSEWHSLFLMNPIAFLLKCYREIFMDGVMPDLLTLTWWGFGSAIMCLLLLVAYQRLRYVFPRIVLE